MTETYEGIPADLENQLLERWVKDRVSQKRFDHIQGVMLVGEQISARAGIDPYPVWLACLLHDACKEIKNDDLLRESKRLGLKIGKQEKDNPHLLHGPVAALTVREAFGIENEDVLCAIAEHTLGSTSMCKISKVVYLADALEASRPNALTEPVWQALGTDGKPDLDAAIFQASNLVLKHLLEKGKPIHIKAVKVRNHFLARLRKRAKKA
ncbi:MAG: bis(5'-nucleosyl)-tetraphosphatase (symmetrical) YqeK [Candidatus Obscuribacterales bacterium]